MSVRHPFGWSYPPGCSGPPEEPEYEQPRCKKCKGFVSVKNAPIEHWEASSLCNGSEGCDNPTPHAPHKIIWDAGSYLVVACKKCGEENKFGG